METITLEHLRQGADIPKEVLETMRIAGISDRDIAEGIAAFLCKVGRYNNTSEHRRLLGGYVLGVKTGRQRLGNSELPQDRRSPRFAQTLSLKQIGELLIGDPSLLTDGQMKEVMCKEDPPPQLTRVQVHGVWFWKRINGAKQ